MKVLVVGRGGREHAICYCVAKSEKADKIYCAPVMQAFHTGRMCADRLNGI